MQVQKCAKKKLCWPYFHFWSIDCPHMICSGTTCICSFVPGRPFLFSAIVYSLLHNISKSQNKGLSKNFSRGVVFGLLVPRSWYPDDTIESGFSWLDFSLKTEWMCNAQYIALIMLEYCTQYLNQSFCFIFLQVAGISCPRSCSCTARHPLRSEQLSRDTIHPFLCK